MMWQGGKRCSWDRLLIFKGGAISHCCSIQRFSNSEVLQSKAAAIPAKSYVMIGRFTNRSMDFSVYNGIGAAAELQDAGDAGRNSQSPDVLDTDDEIELFPSRPGTIKVDDTMIKLIMNYRGRGLEPWTHYRALHSNPVDKGAENFLEFPQLGRENERSKSRPSHSTSLENVTHHQQHQPEIWMQPLWQNNIPIIWLAIFLVYFLVWFKFHPSFDCITFSLSGVWLCVH
ncbi:hypothetical protein QBC42DRAFT_98633 [Cladorrhinum samala]|uniref:Uncharacterized protein n=1 Tax=Cladorrhinum samala TaxID=585594 RepID=A0AAV9HJQ7_9PEZI|nr:hypothetical protein QBC42DRAFT_98633 [Cladorrhinum samala]